jgi:hypothetical protein
MGIAQFMPKVAAESGLANPFDPSQALPASAKLLRELFDQFGNLGYVAAAYNAGAQRVLDWLERGRSLPRETRGYVMNITGRSVEAWRKTPPDDATLRFARRLPCRGLPAFADLEQAQAKQAELHKQAEQAQAEQAELKRKQAEQAQAKQAELQGKQAEQAQANQAEPKRKQAEQAQANQAEPKRKQAEQARAQASTEQASTRHVATQHAAPSQRKTASRQKTLSRLKTASRQRAASRLETASRQKPNRRPQKGAHALAAKQSEKHAHLAKDDRSHKPIRREAVRTAKRERSHEIKEHIRHTLRERHQRA